MKIFRKWHVLIGAAALAAAFCASPVVAQPGAQQKIRSSDVISALESKANKGDVTAQTALGAMYFDGIGVPVDKKKALLWNQRAAEKGSALAMYNLGQAYADPYPSDWSGDPEMNAGAKAQWYAKAFDASEPLAEKGDIEAMYVQGMIAMYSGRYGLANKWLTAAAQKDYPPAQLGLAKLTHGRSRDYRSILALDTSAARTGSSEAMFDLGMAYADTGDKAKAKEWLLRSASLNNLNAIQKLCNAYNVRVGHLPDVAYGPTSCAGASPVAALADDPNFQAFAGAMAFSAALALITPKLPANQAAEARDYYDKMMADQRRRYDEQTTKDFGCGMARLNNDPLMAAMVGGCP